jgi:uncharacterized protein YjiK
MMTALFSWLYFLTVIYPVINQENKKSSNTFRNIEYNLSAPDKADMLPGSLHEISGITELDGSTIACVQDEHGIVYIHDINKNQTIRKINFGGEGDYEGITRVDKTLYILRSDERLTGIENYISDNFKKTVYEIKVPGRDIEGLCYDRKNNRLLIVPKEISEDKPEKKGKRFIYGFDLTSKMVIKGPVISFDIKSIKRFATENNIKVPMKGKDGKHQEPDINMRISEISINPITNKLYALSGSERLLFVFDMSGNIEFLERLDKDLFTQAEGITFLQNGDMFISNEGKNAAATLLRFNFKHAKITKP